MYCMRAVGGPAPQSHNAAARRRLVPAAAARATTAVTATATASATATSSGDRVLAIPVRRSVTVPPTTPSGLCVAAPAARDRAVPRAAGAIARAAQPAASAPIAASIRRGDSPAPAAAPLRARAKKPTPKALTNAATASPAVKATTATATGMATAVTTPPAGTACTSDCNSSHSETNALPGGSAEAARAPRANSAVVTGIGRRSPPSASRSPVPVARSTEPAAQNSRALNAAWLTTCSSAAASANPASVAAPDARKIPAAPMPTKTRPMFSTVEYASSRLRSAATAAWRIPYSAVPAPAASTSSHHQRGPPPSRSRPNRSTPYTPRLTIAALSIADTCDGASGCALGSHTCSGTSPALDPNPTKISTNTNPRSPGGSDPARSAWNVSPPAAAAKESSPIRIATRPRWVITAYHVPAPATAGRLACSASTSSSDVSAINSHSTRNVDTLAAHGTSSSVQANSGSTACTPRPLGPCPCPA